MNITAVIIDDEQSSRETLQHILWEYCPDVIIAGMAESVEKGRELIKQCNPDLVFLDIQMPYRNGFELIEYFHERQFELVFTTAYDCYAIQAIKVSALDYLLKPIDADELIAAVKRVQMKMKELRPQTAVSALAKHEKMSLSDEGTLQWKEQLRMALKSIEQDAALDKIALPLAGGIELVPLRNIIRCEAVANYTRVHLKDGVPMLISRTLKDFERQLPVGSFVRVHHSHLVNIEYITRYLRNEGGQIVLSDGSVIDVARRKRDELLHRLQQQGVRTL